MTMASQFVDMTLSSIFLTLLCVSLFKFRYMSIIHVISLPVFGLWEFLFLKDWPEIWILEIPPSEFCPVSGDWGKLGIPNLARLFLIKSYGMLQNPGLLQLLRFWVIKGKLKKGVKLPLTQIRVKNNNV